MPGPAALALLLSFWPFASDRPPTHFDLICVMKRQEPKRLKPYGKRTLRIDLQTGRWCEDRCEAVNTLKASDQTLELDSPSTPQGPTVIERKVTLNRASGRLRDERRYLLDGDQVGVDLYLGDCKLKPYVSVDKKMF